MTIPLPKSAVPYSSTLGISDFGPFPTDMMRRNSLRGPGAWNFDAAVEKDFPFTERAQLQFRAEGFNVFNHHNYYVNTTTLDYGSGPTTPLFVEEERGGLGTLATRRQPRRAPLRPVRTEGRLLTQPRNPLPPWFDSQSPQGAFGLPAAFYAEAVLRVNGGA